LPASALLPVSQTAARVRAAFVRLAGSGLVRAGMGVVRALIRERRARRAAAQLREWDDRMLHDIGLRRADIASAVRGSRGADASSDTEARPR
jgi:uncharacterized protein YjiS (DUF1127 family)